MGEKMNARERKGDIMHTHIQKSENSEQDGRR